MTDPLPEREPPEREPPEREPLATDLGSFVRHRPLIGCASLAAFPVALTLSVHLLILQAPTWTLYPILMLASTVPFALFVIWARRQNAVRLPSGTIISSRRAQAAGVILWIGALLWMVLTSL